MHTEWTPLEIQGICSASVVPISSVPWPSRREKLQDKHWVQWERNHKKLQFLQSFVFPLQKLNMFSVWMLMLSSEQDYVCRTWALNFQRNGYSALISSHSYFGSEVFASPIQSPRKASFAAPRSKGLSKQRLLRRSLKNTIVTKGIWASL